MTYIDESHKHFTSVNNIYICQMPYDVLIVLIVYSRRLKLDLDLDMKYIYFMFVLHLMQVNTENKEPIMKQNKYCSNPTPKDIPIVYLTLNPVSTVSWLGKITQRQLVLNWKWPNISTKIKRKDESEHLNDWIGLFNINVSNGLRQEGS